MELGPTNFSSIEKSFSADFVEMLARARKYAKAEEAMASRREAAEQPAKMQKMRHEERSQPSSRSLWHEKEPLWPKSLAHSRSPLQKFQIYTPLTSMQAEILMEIEGQGYLRPPLRMRPTESRKYSKKYCHFHRDRGHDTEDCYELRDEIEALVCRGRLSCFVRDHTYRRDPEEQNPVPHDERNNN